MQSLTTAERGLCEVEALQSSAQGVQTTGDEIVASSLSRQEYAFASVRSEIEPSSGVRLVKGAAKSGAEKSSSGVAAYS